MGNAILENRIVCVTNRHLTSDLPAQIKKVASAGIKTIILREKDLSESEYEALAKEVMEICKKYQAECILHNFYDAAVNLKASGLHLPIQKFLSLTGEQKNVVPKLGVSVHSPEEARQCEELGASYLMAGHIFPTDCKKGLPPRGLDFLEEVCRSVSIPVFAIGGIREENMEDCFCFGAAKVCMMSNLMKM